MKIVIIGLGVAGFAAALAVKKTNRNSEVIIIDKKSYDLMHPCSLPFFLGGEIDSNSLKRNLNLDSMKIVKHGNSEVIGINIRDKEVQFKYMKNDHTEKMSYDKLVISSGSSPAMPAIEGVELAYTARDIEDIKKIKNVLNKSKKAVVIGAGAIGLETAVALKRNGLQVTVLDIMDNALPNLIDRDIAEILEEHLKKEGIEFLFNKKIDKIEKDCVTFDSGSVNADIVIVAAGVKPNIELAKNSGIKADNSGIIVDNKMQTNVEDVYAAGDCTQQISLINKKPFNAKLATTAYKQGAVAGVNAAGGNTAYEGALGTFVSKIGNLEVAATGFNSDYAEKEGYSVLTGKATSYTKPEWFPGSKKIAVKIIADKKNGKIIGAHAIGEEGAAARINIIAAAIKAGFTLENLTSVELAYCPAVSDVKDVLIMAAEFGLRKL